MEVDILGHKFILHHDRVLIWPSQNTIIVADMHLGKAQTFQQSGFWLPSTAHGNDLENLAKIIYVYSIEHVLFLGDFVHSTRGVTEDVIKEFELWRHNFKGEITVIIGNHDRPFLKSWPQAWKNISVIETLEVSNIIFQHEPPEKKDLKDGKFIWCGHLHPKLILRKGPDRLRLHTFIIGTQQGYLPAYSSLAGGLDMTRTSSFRYFVAGENEVLEV